MASGDRVPRISEFRLRLQKRMKALAEESTRTDFVLPVALVLVLDEENGGDAVAKELVKRFALLDMESRNFIDFYFLGWNVYENEKSVFDLYDFEDCRRYLTREGLDSFGGNADLILVDAIWTHNSYVTLNLREAIHIDLSAAKSDKDFPTLGSFLQTLIEAAEAVKSDPNGAVASGATFQISDRLGLAIASSSMKNFIMEKWGKIIGAKKLQKLAVRNLGEPWVL